MSLWILFISAFISSTLFPGGSEAVLAYLASDTEHTFIVLVAVATLGNTLGGMTSWGVGRLISIRYSTERLSKASQQKAVERLQQYGSPVLLLSWLPVIGDPLCVAAGWLRIHWLQSLLFISVGKLLRYIVVIYIVGL
ncbi:MAG: DedA family protein [Gammaproteobacteria bacterium]|nr:DedA family protein [Gammaproteobacteria bacterium]MCW9032231.1 DedA family protein [Gammaproteobacteria bacterium]